MSQQKLDLDKISNLLNEAAQGLPKGKRSKPISSQEAGPGCMNRLQTCFIRSMTLGAIVSLSVAIGAILVFWLVPPSVRFSVPSMVASQAMVITQTIPISVTVEAVQGVSCPAVPVNQCPTPPLPVVVIATPTPVLTALTLEKVSNQTNRVVDPITGKVSVDTEIISGSVYNGPQLLGTFSVGNDHLLQKSTVLIQIDSPVFAFGVTPNQARQVIEYYQFVLLQLQGFVRYKVE